MGYYSIFVNVFLCLHYKQGITTAINNSIILCMLFGLIFNGTSSLAAVWQALYEMVEDRALQWIKN
jgi:hypothetical protein